MANRIELTAKLERVSYYRLSGYLYPFRLKLSDNFAAGTTLKEVWGRYDFDRKLRLLAMDAIERVEVYLRMRISNHFAHEHGAFGCDKKENFPHLTDEYFEKLRGSMIHKGKSFELFVRHFSTKYGDSHDILPVWMAMEVLTMGELVIFYRGLCKKMQNQIARPFGVSGEVLLSWLQAIKTARNNCAHHGRLWNKKMGVKPKLRDKKWQMENISNDKVFAILSILQYMMKTTIAPNSKWKKRFCSLLEKYPNIPRSDMGIPDSPKNWPACWK